MEKQTTTEAIPSVAWTMGERFTSEESEALQSGRVVFLALSEDDITRRFVKHLQNTSESRGQQNVTVIIMSEEDYDVEFKEGDIVICVSSSDTVDGDISQAFYDNQIPTWAKGAHMSIVVSAEDMSPERFDGLAEQVLSTFNKFYEIAYLLPEYSYEQLERYEMLQHFTRNLQGRLGEIFTDESWRNPLNEEVVSEVRDFFDNELQEYLLWLQEFQNEGVNDDESLSSIVDELLEFLTNLQSSQNYEVYVDGQGQSNRDTFFYEFSSVLAKLNNLSSELEAFFPPFPLGTIPGIRTPSFRRLVDTFLQMPNSERLIQYLYRFIDIEYGTGPGSPLRASWIAMHTMGTRRRRVYVESTRTVEDVGPLEMLTMPHQETLVSLNAMLTEAIEAGHTVEVYCPVCPGVATMYEVETGLVRFVHEGLAMRSLSWGMMNTVDALEVLIPRLVRFGVNLHVDMALGDFEYEGGIRRGTASKEQFINFINVGNLEMAYELGRRLGQELDVIVEVIIEKGEMGLNVITLRAGGRVEIVFDGIQQMFGGEDQRLLVAKQQNFEERVEAYFQSHINEVLEVVDARRKLKLAQGIEDNPAAMKEALKRDLVDYLIFYHQARQLGGNFTFVVASDSKRLEELAAKIMETDLLYVSGQYVGAS